MGIVVIGATFVDIKGYPLARYMPAGRNVGKVIQVHGGVCRNVAEDIANVELRPVFLSVLDDSGISADVLQKLKDHKVNTDYIRKTENGLGTWLAVFNNDGDVVASISQRPDLSAIAEVLDEFGDEIFSNADSIVVEIDMDHSLLKKIFSLAEKYEKKIYAIVSNMSIAVERRDLLKRTECLVCNQQEAGIFFSEDYEGKNPQEMLEILKERLSASQMKQMIVTMGPDGAVYAGENGESGMVPAINVVVLDTTGAGDAFLAGVAIGLTYGKKLRESCEIGTRLASSVIISKENVCPRFLPEEFGLETEET